MSTMMKCPSLSYPILKLRVERRTKMNCMKCVIAMLPTKSLLISYWIGHR